MAKANPDKVPYGWGETLIATNKDLNCLYSEAVQLSYRSTGRLAPSFDAKDLVAWVRLNYPNLYDEKGHRINK